MEIAERSAQKGMRMTRTRGIGSRSKRNVLLLAILVSTLCGVRAAHGKECLNVSFQDRTSVDGNTLTLNGLGLRQATMLKVNVYVAGLYVAQASTDPNAVLEAPTAKQLILHFVRSVGRSDLNKAWEEGFEANAKGQLPALKERVEKLKGLMTDMKPGERLIFTFKRAAESSSLSTELGRVRSQGMISRKRCSRSGWVPTCRMKA